jgi:hypothetical protein
MNHFRETTDKSYSIKCFNLARLKSIKVCVCIFMIIAFPIDLVYAQSGDIELNMSDPALWTVDIVHLGSKQIDITFDSKENAAVMHPKWSINDTTSPDVSVRNIENGRLHLYQHIKMSDHRNTSTKAEWNSFSHSRLELKAIIYSMDILSRCQISRIVAERTKR